MARVWRVDGQLVSSQAGIFVAGLFAAVLLGSPHSGPQVRAGLVVVILCSVTLVFNVAGRTPPGSRSRRSGPGWRGSPTTSSATR